MIGAGTVKATLAGILTDALKHGRTAAIYLFHGSRYPDSLYRFAQMRNLADGHGNFHYFPCVSGPDVPERFMARRACELALETVSDLKSWRVFLCGHPGMVNQTKRKAFLKGSEMADTYTDAFINQPVPASAAPI